MQYTRIFGQLGRNDVKLIGRDSFLLSLTFYVFIIAGLLRVAIPWLSDQVMTNYNYDLAPLYPLIVSYFVLIMLGGVLAGTIVGFLLLEEKDDATIKAMLVMPLPINMYLLYRVLLPAFLAFLLIIASTLIVNAASIPMGQLIVVAAGGSLLAPVVALFMGTFANNKVEGFALLKLLGTSGILVFLAWFLETPLQYLVGLYPPYWIAKGFWQAAAGASDWWIFIAIGAAYSVVVLLLLIRRFKVVASR